MIIDLRSDTLTKPAKGMLDAMFAAAVGDDVFNDDPTVIALQEKVAKLFDKEAALFCGSGIMCNQVAIKLQVAVDQKVLCDELSHIYYHEKNGPAFLSGIQHHLVNTPAGKLNAALVDSVLTKENQGKKNIALVSLENTVNKGGGCYYTLNEIKEIADVSKMHNVPMHLDGARIFNALVETGDTPAEIVQYFETISFCLSKGLGTPVGSMLVSSNEKIEEARKIRNQFGGGMRQIGYLAAAGIYALDNNINRLKEDHLRAKRIGEELVKLSFVEKLIPVQTNVVIFHLRENIDDVHFMKQLADNNIRTVSFGKQIVRMVTHMDITDEMVDETIRVLKQFESLYF